MIKYIFPVLFLLITVDSNADHRHYVWTYEYQIMEPGTSEFEQYTTFKTSDMADAANSTSTELNFELEAGMNKFFDFAIYQVFTQNPGSTLKYSGFKLRSRFKIGEKNMFFIDPLIYIEYKGVPGFSDHKFETKLILAKDIGNFNISFNPYFELSRAKADKEWEFEPKYAFGICYNLSELFSFGIESAGSESGIYAGPTISHGGHDLWISAGALSGIGNIDKDKPKFQLRFIIGVGL